MSGRCFSKHMLLDMSCQNEFVHHLVLVSNCGRGVILVTGRSCTAGEAGDGTSIEQFVKYDFCNCSAPATMWFVRFVHLLYFYLSNCRWDVPSNWQKISFEKTSIRDGCQFIEIEGARNKCSENYLTIDMHRLSSSKSYLLAIALLSELL